MKMEYKTIAATVAIVIAAFIVSCDQKPPDRNRKLDPVVKPSPTPTKPRRGEPSSFSKDVTELIDNHDMLSPEASKEWLRKNSWEVTSHSDNQITIQRNYQSGNITDRRKVSLGSKGQRGVSIINNIVFTVDNNDNIRVGLRKSESD